MPLFCSAYTSFFEKTSLHLGVFHRMPGSSRRFPPQLPQGGAKPGYEDPPAAFRPHSLRDILSVPFCSAPALLPLRSRKNAFFRNNTPVSWCRLHGCSPDKDLDLPTRFLPPDISGSFHQYTSLILGHPRSTLVPVLKSAAAITGSAAFFDPWIRTLPCSGLPPVTMISSISFKYSTPKRPLTCYSM